MLYVSTILRLIDLNLHSSVSATIQMALSRFSTPFWRVGKQAWNNSVCMEIRCQITFIRHRFRKIHELETFSTRKRILGKQNWRDVTVPESVQSCFELSIHLSVKRTSCELPLKIVRGKKNTGKCMENSKHNWTLSGTATSLQCQKFPIHEFFRSDVLWNLFDIGFPYKHCYFKPVCLLVKKASKTVIVSRLRTLNFLSQVCTVWDILWLSELVNGRK